MYILKWPVSVYFSVDLKWDACTSSFIKWWKQKVTAPVYVTSHSKISYFGHSLWTRTGQQAVTCSDVSETKWCIKASSFFDLLISKQIKLKRWADSYYKKEVTHLPNLLVLRSLMELIFLLFNMVNSENCSLAIHYNSQMLQRLYLQCSTTYEWSGSPPGIGSRMQCL